MAWLVRQLPPLLLLLLPLLAVAERLPHTKAEGRQANATTDFEVGCPFFIIRCLLYDACALLRKMSFFMGDFKLRLNSRLE